MQINPFTKFNNEWALVTSGSRDRFNTMTISWGSMGTIWNRDVVTVYIRPDRYTWEFLNKHEYFTVSFYDEAYKSDLQILGTLSGRSENKLAKTKLTPKFLKDDIITFNEAKETFVLKKIYMAQMEYDKEPDYAKKIYVNGIKPHYLIMGEVVKIIESKQ